MLIAKHRLKLYLPSDGMTKSLKCVKLGVSYLKNNNDCLETENEKLFICIFIKLKTLENFKKFNFFMHFRL